MQQLPEATERIAHHFLAQPHTKLQYKERMYGQGWSLPVVTQWSLILNNALTRAGQGPALPLQ
jgi:predicted alpha/beta hydrolase family esterase